MQTIVFNSDDIGLLERQVEEFNHDRLILDVRYVRNSRHWTVYVMYIDL